MALVPEPWLGPGVAHTVEKMQSLLPRADKPSSHVEVTQMSVPPGAQATHWLGHTFPLGL